ncbi:MAG: ChbG/HpnK family deacetylase [Anaerolineae bacterium]|nr:ChbG/HpnK family deacetylase [Anaerolineae bacterium]
MNVADRSACWLVVNADDFGLTEGTNQAILEAHQRGIVTSTSLLANGQAFDHAVQLALATPTLGVGVHLTLTEGVPLSAELRSILPTLPLNNQPYAWMLLRGRLPRDQIRAEFVAQVQRIIAAGITPTHLDGHKYIQLLPGISQLAAQVARQFNIPVMRAPRCLADYWLQRPSRIAGLMIVQAMSVLARRQAQRQHLRTVDRLIGFADTGHLTAAAIRHLLAAKRSGITELLCHPAHRSEHLDRLYGEGYRWIAGYDFDAETAAVSDPALRSEVIAAGWQLTHFGALS